MNDLDDKSEESRTAYYEAAHIVVAIALGRSIDHVQIGEDPPIVARDEHPEFNNDALKAENASNPT
jgi:hypothetical protein